MQLEFFKNFLYRYFVTDSWSIELDGHFTGNRCKFNGLIYIISFHQERRNSPSHCVSSSCSLYHIITLYDLDLFDGTFRDKLDILYSLSDNGINRCQMIILPFDPDMLSKPSILILLSNVFASFLQNIKDKLSLLIIHFQ